jgi:hypothetical protein
MAIHGGWNDSGIVRDALVVDVWRQGVPKHGEPCRLAVFGVQKYLASSMN